MKKSLITVTIMLMLTGCTPSLEADYSGFEFQTEIEQTDTSQEMVQTSETDVDVVDTIYIHVCGAVNAPGVYALPYGSRAYEAVEAAGGVTDQAAVYLVNLAETLTDEQKLYIPAEGEELMSQQGDITAPGRVNINTADKDALMKLTGIGEAKAEAIIKYRKKIGGFTSIEQIMEVDGIKQSAYDKIADDITI